jgi:lipoprotein-releasing system permease protein
LVGCFSITITLVLAVKRKTREMAILRAMGYEKLDLGRLFLLHGLSIGVLGVAIGLVVGFGLLAALGSERFALLNTLYAGKNIPVRIDWAAVASVSLGSVTLAMLAAVWPAVEVMKIDVVQSLSDRQ